MQNYLQKLKLPSCEIIFYSADASESCTTWGFVDLVPHHIDKYVAKLDWRCSKLKEKTQKTKKYLDWTLKQYVSTESFSTNWKTCFFPSPQTDDWFPGLLIDCRLPFSHYSFLHKVGPAVCAGVGSMRELMRYSNERAHVNDRSGLNHKRKPTCTQAKNKKKIKTFLHKGASFVSYVFLFYFLFYCKPSGTDVLSHPSDSLAPQRPSIFTMALINHQQTLKLCRETEDEPPTDTVPVKKQAFYCRDVYISHRSTCERTSCGFCSPLGRQKVWSVVR